MRRRAAFVLGLSLACRLSAGADSPPVGEDVRVQQALRLLEAWEDSLAVLSLPTDNPTGDALGKLKPAGEHRFRRVRPDGSGLGEEVVFETGPDGTPTRMLRHSNYATRVR